MIRTTTEKKTIPKEEWKNREDWKNKEEWKNIGEKYGRKNDWPDKGDRRSRSRESIPEGKGDYHDSTKRPHTPFEPKTEYYKRREQEKTEAERRMEQMEERIKNDIKDLFKEHAFKQTKLPSNDRSNSNRGQRETKTKDEDESAEEKKRKDRYPSARKEGRV